MLLLKRNRWWNWWRVLSAGVTGVFDGWVGSMVVVVGGGREGVFKEGREWKPRGSQHLLATATFCVNTNKFTAIQ